MDGLTRQIASYAAHASDGGLPEATVNAAIKRLVDGLGCAIAA